MDIDSTHAPHHPTQYTKRGKKKKQRPQSQPTQTRPTGLRSPVFRISREDPRAFAQRPGDQRGSVQASSRLVRQPPHLLLPPSNSISILLFV